MALAHGGDTGPKCESQVFPTSGAVALRPHLAVLQKAAELETCSLLLYIRSLILGTAKMQSGPLPCLSP